jgi:undecaprenyl pyrophosphate phosphatase UppP
LSKASGSEADGPEDVLQSVNFLPAIVIGLVQGLTQLFPISCLGHTVLVPSWIGSI